jgi:hypothetical protein
MPRMPRMGQARAAPPIRRFVHRAWRWTLGQVGGRGAVVREVDEGPLIPETAIKLFSNL